MFDSIMNTLWPVKDLLSAIFQSSLKNCFLEEVDIIRMEKEIREKSFSEVNNLSLDKNGLINKFLINTRFQLKEGSVSRIYINFPKTYLKDKTEIIIENLNIILCTRNDDNEEIINNKITKNDINSAIQKIINQTLDLLEITIKNISISYSHNEKDYYKLLIGNIKYNKFRQNEKNAFFLFNKEIKFTNLLIKYEYGIKRDDDFFDICEKNDLKRLLDYYTNSKVVFVMNLSDDHTSLLIRFNKKDSNGLDISFNVAKIESIINKFHMNCFTEIINMLKNNTNSKLIMKNIKNEAINLFGFKINDVNFNANIRNVNFVILENDKYSGNKIKMWLMYDNFFKKYYLSEINNNEFNTDNIEAIQRHFVYFEENFFVINFRDINFMILKKLSERGYNTDLSIMDINFRYIEPNNIPIKKDLIIINNVITNEFEKYFDEKFCKIFLNTIKFDYSIYTILSIKSKKDKAVFLNYSRNIDENYSLYKNNAKVLISEIDVDINFPLLLKIYSTFTIFDLTINNNIEENYDNNCNYQISNNIGIFFKLNIKFSELNNSNKIFKEYYNYYIHPIYEKNSYDSKLKLGNEYINEFIIIKINNSEIIIEDRNFYFNMSRLTLYFCKNSIYFPLFIFKNSNFISSYKDFGEDYKDIGKKYIMALELKHYSTINEFNNSVLNDLKYYLNASRIKKNESFFMDDVKTDIEYYSLNKNFNNYRPLISINLDKISIFMSYNYAKEFIKFRQKLIYSSKYVSYFTQFKDHKEGKRKNESFFFSLNIEVSQIDIIGFSNIIMNDNSFYNKDNRYLFDNNLLDKYIDKDENIFNLIENPLLKINLKCLKYSAVNYFNYKYYQIITVDDFRFLVRKNDNIYHDVNFKYLIFFQKIYEEENFEYLIYKANTNSTYQRNIFSSLIKYQSIMEKINFNLIQPIDIFSFFNEINRKQICNIKLDLIFTVDDIVINPLFKNMDEIISMLERIKSDYLKSLIIVKNNYDNFNSHEIRTDNNFNRKVFSNNHILDMNIKINISKVVLDLYNSYNKNFKPIELKDKMRLITEIEGLIYEEKRNPKNNDIKNIQFSVERINSLFLKNLDFKRTTNILINKVDNISKENSFFKKLGFVEIMSTGKFLVMISKDKEDYVKSELILNFIEFNFCKDSFRNILRFIYKCKKDLIHLSTLINLNMDDKDSVVTELEMIQEKILTDIQFPLKHGSFDNNIVYKKINLQDNNKIYNNLIKQHSFTLDNTENVYIDSNFDKRSFSSNAKSRRNDYHSELAKETLIKPTDLDLNINISEDAPIYDNSKISENFNLFFIIQSLRIYIFDGKDFSFDDKYYDYNSTVESHDENLISEFKIIDDYFEKVSGVGRETADDLIRCRNIPRNYQSYLNLSLNNTDLKFFYFKNSPIVFTFLFEISHLILEDCLKNSKYKKIISVMEDSNEALQFLTIKFDLLKIKKDMEISIYLQLSSLNLHLDQLTLKFIIQFFKLKLVDLNEEKEDEVVTSHMDNTVISTIGDNKINERSGDLLNLTSKKYNLLIRRIIIQEFQFHINYNSHYLDLENMKEKEILKMLNISNVTDLKIIFKSYDFKGRKKSTEVMKELYTYWKDDILKSQIVQAYLSSISLIRPFKNIVGGFIQMFKQPYQNFIHDKSIEDGVISGVKKFVVNFTTESLILGEKILTFCNIMVNNSKKKSRCRKLLHNINPAQKTYDDEYLKY